MFGPFACSAHLGTIVIQITPPANLGRAAQGNTAAKAAYIHTGGDHLIGRLQECLLISVSKCNDGMTYEEDSLPGWMWAVWNGMRGEVA